MGAVWHNDKVREVIDDVDVKAKYSRCGASIYSGGNIMKKKKMLALLASICMVLLLAVIPFISACAEEEPAPAPTPTPTPAPAPTPTPTPKPEAIVLRGVSFVPTNARVRHFLEVLAERVNERAKGKLVIEDLGGPEVIPMFEQGEATKMGVIDINLQTAGLLASEVPEGNALYVSQVSATVERERGLNDFLEKLYNEKVNLHLMGRVARDPHFLASSKKVEKPEDVAGLKVRSLRAGNALLESLDASPVVIALGEAYTSLERGVCDAFFGSIHDIVNLHLYEVVGYAVDHSVYDPVSVVCFMNLDTWNGLPPDLQDLITEIMIEFETDVPIYFEEIVGEAKLKYEELGGEFVKFSPEDAERWVELADEVKWEEVKGMVSPESYNKLRGFLLK